MLEENSTNISIAFHVKYVKMDEHLIDCISIDNNNRSEQSNSFEMVRLNQS